MTDYSTIQYGLTALVALASLSIAFLLPRRGVGLSWLGGLALVWIGQRMLGGGDVSLPATVAGLLVVFATVVLRVRSMAAAKDAAAATERAALIWQLVGTSSIAVWFLTTDTATGALGYTGDALDRWTVAWTALWPILALVGALPVLLLDNVLAAHPVQMPEGARKHAVASGLSLAFGFALVFPVNYLANQHDADWDFSYFRVTQPGTSTLAIVATLDTPVEVMLFYPPANDTREQLVPYFEELVANSGGKLTLKLLDQPSEPELSKELSVRDNGYIVLKKGDAKEKFRVDTDIKKARKDLKKLDGTVQKYLLKLTRSKRVVYMLTGHNEASPRETNPFFKLNDVKTELTNQNYDVKDFGLEQGSATAVPDDAALVIVAAPEKALLPEESKALAAYADKGGALFVFADPQRDPMPELLAHLGVRVGTHPLANNTKIIPITNGPMDKANLISQRFGSHPVTATLSKYATKAAVVMPTVVAVSETGAGTVPGPAKYTPLIRSYEDTWEDLNDNLVQDKDEPSKVYVMAMAVQGPDTAKYRAVVLGDVSAASDFVLERAQGNQVLVLDAVRWLVGDEDIAGEIASEEDVQIEHTHEQDVVWFYAIIFGIPLSVLALGAVVVRRRTAGA
jgi:hypothetical protein